MANDPRQLLRSGLLNLALSLALPLMAIAANTSLEVTKIDGTKLRGELVAWNAAKLTLQTEHQTVAVESPQLLRVQWQRNRPGQTKAVAFLELTDGTRLPHKAYRVEHGLATLETPLSEQPLSLSTEFVTYAQLSADAPQREEIDRDLDGDVLVIHKKKTAGFDQLSGIISAVTPEQVEFNWDGEAISVKRSKVAAIAYFHAQPPKGAEPICRLNLLDGGRLPIAEISLLDQKLQVRTTGGLKLSFALNLLHDADYSAGKLVYLSDLKPIEQRWTPLIGLPSAAGIIRQHGLPRRDQSFAGSALALRWPATKSGRLKGVIETYDKGLALRSHTVSRYHVPSGMKRFVTIAGIDPVTASQGNVTLEIFADRRSVWQGEIDGDAAPTEIDITLGDARELRIVVDYGENLDFGDRLHLVEARLSR